MGRLKTLKRLFQLWAPLTLHVAELTLPRSRLLQVKLLSCFALIGHEVHKVPVFRSYTLISRFRIFLSDSCFTVRFVTMKLYAVVPSSEQQ